jgi:hypothetical protein
MNKFVIVLSVCMMMVFLGAAKCKNGDSGIEYECRTAEGVRWSHITDPAECKHQGGQWQPKGPGGGDPDR